MKGAFTLIGLTITSCHNTKQLLFPVQALEGNYSYPTK
ncbi:hypothetical protein ACIN5111_2964 [Acinetobacter baumannii OIFC111]|nr:hypothetical protein ACIN5111_2964 [Acinetobacter baumannii OIFC111]EXB40693.1 putative lipoprotein [Acinetobacter baumannii 1461963]